MIKRKTKGSEGYVTSFGFKFIGRSWLVAISETKWHAGEKYKKTPIWFNNINGEIRTLFIWKFAIGYGVKK